MNTRITVSAHFLHITFNPKGILDTTTADEIGKDHIAKLIDMPRKGRVTVWQTTSGMYMFCFESDADMINFRLTMDADAFQIIDTGQRGVLIQYTNKVFYPDSEQIIPWDEP